MRVSGIMKSTIGGNTRLPMCQNGNTFLPNPTSVGHNTELICGHTLVPLVIEKDHRQLLMESAHHSFQYCSLRVMVMSDTIK